MSPLEFARMKPYRLKPGAIREARHRSHMNQADLAEVVGCARNSIHRAEKYGCGDGLAKLIAKALGVEIDSLYVQEETLLTTLTPDQKEVLLGMAGLNGDAIRVLRIVVTALQANPAFASAPSPTPDAQLQP